MPPSTTTAALTVLTLLSCLHGFPAAGVPQRNGPRVLAEGRGPSAPAALDERASEDLEKTHDYPPSGDCHVDVVCPVAAPYRQPSRAAVLLQFGGHYFCSGTLINNTALDRRPLVLTSAHCGIRPGNQGTVIAYFNHESSTCRGEPGGAGASDGTLGQTVAGARWLAEYVPSDMKLIELAGPVPAAYRAHYAGWDRSPGEHDGTAGVHHPRHQEKRISFAGAPTTTTSLGGTVSPGDGTHLRVEWSLGWSEPGSSGSALFTDSGHVVGQLHQGPSNCDVTDGSAWYGRLSVAWEGGGTAVSRLRDWLDPLHAERPSPWTLDGLDEDELLRDGFESGGVERWTVVAE